VLHILKEFPAFAEFLHRINTMLIYSGIIPTSFYTQNLPQPGIDSNDIPTFPRDPSLKMVYDSTW